MAHKFAAVKVGAHLQPCDSDGRDIIRRVAAGQPMMVEIKPSRSTQQHRLAMGLIRRVWENVPEKSSHLWPTMETFRYMLLEATGYSEEYTRIDGSKCVKAKSIAFDRMDSIEFSQFFEAAIDLIQARIIPGLDSQALKDEVLDMIAGGGT